MKTGGISWVIGNKEIGNKIDVEINKLRDQKDKSAKASEMVGNWILFGVTDRPKTQPTKLTKERWDEMIKDITGSPALLSELVKKDSKQLLDASEYCVNEIKTLETNKEAEGVQDKIARYKELSDLVQNANKMFMTPMLDKIVRDFYSVNYQLYRQIVTAYQQQNKSGQLQQTQQQQNEQQQNAETADNVGTPPQGDSTAPTPTPAPGGVNNTK